MDIELDFYVVRSGGSWRATERDNYAQWGTGVSIGEAIQDYCDQYVTDDELLDHEDDDN